MSKSQKKLEYKDMESTEINKTKLQEKRNYLIGLSRPIQMLVKEGAFSSVNEGLIKLYAENGHSELKTIFQWNKEGKRVKKGEKALLLWGSPKKTSKQAEQGSESQEATEQEETGKDFYPICYVFSNLQVMEKGGAK